ncbi:DUF2835 family protein [Kushneria sinocarnis]|nr:DUF2835 family protein [Kushneria sinocarnis]
MFHVKHQGPSLCCHAGLLISWHGVSQPSFAMPTIDIVLNLSAQQCRSYYAGAAEHIHTHSPDGRKVLLPARALHRIVGPSGVQGVYRMTYDDNGRFVSLERIGAL